MNSVKVKEEETRKREWRTEKRPKNNGDSYTPPFIRILTDEHVVRSKFPPSAHERGLHPFVG